LKVGLVFDLSGLGCPAVDARTGQVGDLPYRVATLDDSHIAGVTVNR